ncbi:MAG TPA: hypothetical protein PK867_01700 [Pirellulales bacterium]|nr:hypothetical protein [Pirellulales bacterium]
MADEVVEMINQASKAVAHAFGTLIAAAAGGGQGVQAQQEHIELAREAFGFTLNSSPRRPCAVLLARIRRLGISAAIEFGGLPQGAGTALARGFERSALLLFGTIGDGRRVADRHISRID